MPSYINKVFGKIKIAFLKKFKVNIFTPTPYPLPQGRGCFLFFGLAFHCLRQLARPFFNKWILFFALKKLTFSSKLFYYIFNLSISFLFRDSEYEAIYEKLHQEACLRILHKVFELRYFYVIFEVLFLHQLRMYSVISL